MIEIGELTGRDVALLCMLEDTGRDFGRAYEISRAFGHDHSALFMAVARSWGEEALRQGHVPVLLTPAEIADLTEGGLDYPRFIALLRRRGLPEEFEAAIERELAAPAPAH